MKLWIKSQCKHFILTNNFRRWSLIPSIITLLLSLTLIILIGTVSNSSENCDDAAFHFKNKCYDIASSGTYLCESNIKQIYPLPANNASDFKTANQVSQIVEVLYILAVSTDIIDVITLNGSILLIISWIIYQSIFWLEIVLEMFFVILGLVLELYAPGFSYPNINNDSCKGDNDNIDFQFDNYIVMQIVVVSFSLGKILLKQVENRIIYYEFVRSINPVELQNFNNQQKDFDNLRKKKTLTNEEEIYYKTLRLHGNIREYINNYYKNKLDTIQTDPTLID